MLKQTVNFEGIHNFRDMGGLVTSEGKVVKPNLLYRSGHLADATEGDIEELKNLGVKCIFDYRDDEEALKNPTPIIKGIKYIREPAITTKTPIKATDILELLEKNTVQQIIDDFSSFYASMPFNNESYRKLLKQFIACEGPLLHHCTAGKDRTGVGAALMYLSLGVSENDIITEYLLTNEANKKNEPKWYTELASQLEDAEGLKAVSGVREEFITAVFEKIKEKYGTYASYFAEEYSMTEEDLLKIKKYYLS